MSNTCGTGIVFQWYKGDSRTYRFTVRDKDTKQPINIDGWPIAAEVWDAATGEVKKRTVNIVDGSDNQIKVIDGEAGIFEVYFLKGETTDFGQDATLEIAEYSDGGKNTIYRIKLKFWTPEIDWVVLI